MKPVNKLLIDLIRIPSFSGEEIKICNYVYNLLKKEGFLVAKAPVDRSGYNIVAKAGTPKIYLSAHLDTVRPALPIKETTTHIYGRGACDTKGSIVAMILAALECKNQGFKNFGLIFTVGEEIDFRGAEKIIKSGLRIPCIVVGEPTSLDLVYGHFGMLGIRLVSHGKKAHSSESQKGINAIDKLIEAVNRIKKIKVYKKSSLSVCEVQGGVAPNVIPDKAEASISLRIFFNDKTDYFKKIKKAVGSLVKIEKVHEFDSVLVKAPRELAFIKGRRTVKYGTELSLYKNGVVLGPGNIKHAHTEKDQIKKSELEKAVKIYKQIIYNFN